VQAEAKRNGVSNGWKPSRGKGSHGTVYYGANQTIVKDLKKEISKGLLSAMKKQLGVNFWEGVCTIYLIRHYLRTMRTAKS
jgi:predicted RNA binding protein YcfA (HicA-like mRNA interferase family)